MDQNQEGEGNGIVNKMSNQSIDDLREYNQVVEILRKYGVASVNLISINKRKIDTIQNDALLGSNIFYMENFIELHKINERVLSKIEKGANYPILRHEGTRRVFVIGDLNVDQFQNIDGLSAGGTGYNAWRAFTEEKFDTILFGRVAEDELGRFFMNSVRENIRNDRIDGRKSSAIIDFGEQIDIIDTNDGRRCNERICRIHANKKRLMNTTGWCRNSDKKLTGFVCLTPTNHSLRYYYYNWCHLNNINDYNGENLKKALTLTELNETDFVYISSFLFVHKGFDVGECKEFFRVLGQTGAKLILDLVDQDIPKILLLEDLIDCVSLCNPAVIVGEYLTFKDFIYTTKMEQLEHPNTTPVRGEQELFLAKF